MNLNATLIGQSIAFLFFVLFCMKYIWPALISVMQTREQRIAQGLDMAERADKDLELAKQNATQQMREAKDQAAQIVEQANKRANNIVSEASEHARAEAERIKAQAQLDIEHQLNQAREKLRAEVVVLALAGAEKVLASSIDASKHNAMLEKLAAQL